MADNNLPSLSVIIPVYNGGKKFRKCIEALELCYPRPLEIIVVADSVSDGSWRSAQEKGHPVIILGNNQGPANARNEGAVIAQGEILLFIDADVLVEENIIEIVSNFFLKNNQHDAVIGSYDDAPFEQGLVSQYKNLLHHFTHQHSAESVSTFWGACGAVRTSVFLAQGGFSAQYKTASIEDIEFGYRLKESGCEIRLLKNLQVKHLKKWDFNSMIKTDIFKRAIPWSELLIARDVGKYDLNLSCSTRLSIVLTFILVLSIVVCLSSPVYLSVTVSICCLLTIINRRFYLFLLRKRGIIFLLQSIPLHWLYFLYSGLSFAYVLLKNTFMAPVFSNLFGSHFKK